MIKYYTLIANLIIIPGICKELGDGGIVMGGRVVSDD